MLDHEIPSQESLMHLRTDIMWVLTILHENHDPETVAAALMHRLGANYNQTGVAGDPDFLSGTYWWEIDKALQAADRTDPFDAPDAVSGIYTNEIILAQELEKAGYTAQEALAVIKKMREKERMRQLILSRKLEVSTVTDDPAHPDMTASSKTRVIKASS